MACCELTKPLLQDDDECFEENYCFMNNMLNEDSSSGYESTDSETEDQKRSNEYNVPVNRQEIGHVSARVKSTHSLCESLKLIMEIPELCDVIFLLGPKEIPVYGVRAILGTRSK
ncbi:uncharacterized protein LOC132727399 [Ruditapes philippinarum]|uniref:uncharacterized protein LOC132727399 n=1 Tax=Ruditapes philippinarum TaxID=129788 RepID=UPI00295A8C56|nr:uncharacterized protein LOC132727399 [Ruditapes philippinarum]